MQGIDIASVVSPTEERVCLEKRFLYEHCVGKYLSNITLGRMINTCSPIGMDVMTTSTL